MTRYSSEPGTSKLGLLICVSDTYVLPVLFDHFGDLAQHLHADLLSLQRLDQVGRHPHHAVHQRLAVQGLVEGVHAAGQHQHEVDDSELPVPEEVGVNEDQLEVGAVGLDLGRVESSHQAVLGRQAGQTDVELGVLADGSVEALQGDRVGTPQPGHHFVGRVPGQAVVDLVEELVVVAAGERGLREGVVFGVVVELASGPLAQVGQSRYVQVLLVEPELVEADAALVELLADLLDVLVLSDWGLP